MCVLAYSGSPLSCYWQSVCAVCLCCPLISSSATFYLLMTFPWVWKIIPYEWAHHKSLPLHVCYAVLWPLLSRTFSCSFPLCISASRTLFPPSDHSWHLMYLSAPPFPWVACTPASEQLGSHARHLGSLRFCQEKLALKVWRWPFVASSSSCFLPLLVSLSLGYKPEYVAHRGKVWIVLDWPSVGNILWPVGGFLLWGPKLFP